MATGTKGTNGVTGATGTTCTTGATSPTGATDATGTPDTTDAKGTTKHDRHEKHGRHSRHDKHDKHGGNAWSRVGGGGMCRNYIVLNGRWVTARSGRPATREKAFIGCQPPAGGLARRWMTVSPKYVQRIGRWIHDTHARTHAATAAGRKQHWHDH